MNAEYLKHSIKENELERKKIQKKRHVNDKILNIVRKFIIDKKLICYGGTAINDILPKEQQFYNYETDIPDYDFFSPNAIEDAKELCNIFTKENVHNIESKNAFVYGTYKVFVNFVAIADITQIDKGFYEYLLKHNIQKDKVLYTPPEFLRMSLHQELARPLGDISRWEKVYSRLHVLNNYFPILTKNKLKTYYEEKLDLTNIETKEAYEQLFQHFRKNKMVFCNFDITIRLMHKYMKIGLKYKKDFTDIFIMYTDNLPQAIKGLKDKSIEGLEVKKVKSVYKFVDNYCYLSFRGKVIGIMFATNSCLAYNVVKHKRRNIQVGNIDTLLNLYFSLLLINDMPLNKTLIKEVIDKLQYVVNNYGTILEKYEHISSIPEKLKRFNLPCYGKQQDKEDILKERSSKYRKFRKNKTSKEYQKWFFKYSPRIKNKTRKKQKLKKK
tara:strand:+ start:3356 stop:4675 length:1320 start_codon:yes stop_codon:yes gene_type:complete